eukprot:scaffold281_cov65-Cylindrotheca_fusiformis.AAC.1
MGDLTLSLGTVVEKKAKFVDRGHRCGGTSNAHVSGVTTSLESYEDAVVAEKMASQTVHQTVPECGQRQRKRGWIPLQILPCQTTAHLGPGGLLEHGL